MKPPTRLAASLIPLLLAASAAAQEPSPPPHYDLLAPELVAVELAGVDEAVDLAGVLERHGLGLRREDPYGPREFHLLELDAVVTDASARTALLNDLRAEPGVEYVSSVYRDELGLPEFPSRDLIVRFEEGVPVELQRQALESLPEVFGAHQPWDILPDTWMAGTETRFGSEVLALLDQLNAMAGVRWAESDRVGGVIYDFVPNDPLFAQAWGLDNTGQTTGPLPPSNNSWTGIADVDMDLPEAWDITTGSAAITVVVFDNGVDLGHPDLPVAAGADFTGMSSGGGPTNLGACHGTAVAGCIRATIGNNLGTVGSAPGCSLASAAITIPQSISSCTNQGAGQSSWKIDALYWAILIGARVTNSSYSTAFDQSVADAFSATKVAGMLHFASSGNSFPNPIGFPAYDDDVVAVGNIRPDGVIAGSSQTGTVLDVVGPGTNVMTTDISGPFGYVNSDYAMVNGTSFASPYVAGVAALVLSQHPTLSPNEVTWILKLSADDYGSPCEDSTYGAGLVNAYRALQLATDFANGSVQVYNGGGASAFYPTVADGVNAASPGQLVLVHEGSYAESLTITKPLLLRRWTLLEGGCGPAVVGE